MIKEYLGWVGVFWVLQVCNWVFSDWGVAGKGWFRVEYRLGMVKLPGNQEFESFEEAKEGIGCFGEYNRKWCERIEWVDKAAKWLIGLNIAALACIGVWIWMIGCVRGTNKCKRAFFVVGIGIKAAALVVWVVISGVRFSDQCDILVVGENVVTGCAWVGVGFELLLFFLFTFGHLAFAVLQ